MKKIKLFLMTLMVTLSSCMFLDNAFAATNDSTITYQKMDGVYFYLKNNVSGAIDTNHVTKFYMNGNLSYCIEPLVDITEKTYNSTTNWSVTGLSAETRHYMELVGYFGYDYPSHRTDRYWLAAQALIWEKVNANVSVKFTTAENGGGNIIDLSREKNEITSLINNYDTKPSFNTQTIEGTIGDTITITDKNNVLSNYDLVYSGKHKITQNGNNLTVTLNDSAINEETVAFKIKTYTNKTTIIYYQGNSQKLATFGLSDPSVATFKLKSKGATVEVNKKGEQLVKSDASFHFEEIQLPNVVFAIYANEDIIDSNGNIVYKKYELIGTIKTSESGIAELENMYYGKYFLIEGETSFNHVPNEEKYYFEITKDDLVEGKIVKTLAFKNYLAKGTLDFTKIDEHGNPIANTTIMIFDSEDRLLGTYTTDSNGKVVLENKFVVGDKYYILEKSAANGYEITDEKIWFEITKNGEVVKANMTNKKIEIIKDKPEIIVEIPETHLDKNFIIEIIAITIIISGVIIIFYAKRKHKK